VSWDTQGKWRWITRRYSEPEEEQLQAHNRKYQIVERLLAVQQRQRKARQAAEQEHLAAIEALLQRQKALAKPVVARPMPMLTSRRLADGRRSVAELVAPGKASEHGTRPAGVPGHPNGLPGKPLLTGQCPPIGAPRCIRVQAVTDR